jgi:hypothetical protein
VTTYTRDSDEAEWPRPKAPDGFVASAADTLALECPTAVRRIVRRARLVDGESDGGAGQRQRGRRYAGRLRADQQPGNPH